MSEALKEYKVAAINCEPKMFEKENNLKKQYALVEEAAKNGARLIALPEMATIPSSMSCSETPPPGASNI